METININGTPPNVGHYRLDDGRCIRIVLALVTKEVDLPTASFIEVETRGYEITDAGDFVTDANLEPVTIKAQRARIPLEPVRAGLDSMKPGWVLTDEEPGDLDEHFALPEVAEHDDRVLMGGHVYRYTLGLYEKVRRMRVSEVAAPPVALDLDALRP